MTLREKLLVRAGKSVKLANWDPDDTLGFTQDEETERKTAKGIARLDELQRVMYAERRHALLVVLQGMDSAGKDGTIRHVMRAFNPQGCRVTPFKVPTAQEADHDFLWRVHHAVPGRGDIGIFNRSHYEDVLIARVRKFVPKEVWSGRYEHINHFEQLLSDNAVSVVKIFLHISKDEQKRRFEERLVDPAKQWKLAPSDFTDRKYWDDYVVAYEDALERCNAAHAPWFVVPANKKWFRNLAVSHLLVETLEALDMHFPKPSFDLSQLKLE